MKRLIALVCVVVMVGSLFACAGNGMPNETASPSTSAGGALILSENSDADFDTSGDIVVETEFQVYGRDAPWVSYTITNNTSEELVYGAPFGIEVRLDGKWYQVPFPENTAWITIGYILKANETNVGRFSFSQLDYKMADGQYRLTKAIGDNLYFAPFQVGKSPITAETPFGYQALEKLPKDYSQVEAAGNGDIVITFGETKNADRLNKFVNKAALGMPAMVRIVQYTVEGDPIITDFIYKQTQSDYYLYRQDNSRDAFGGTGIGITEKIYSYLITDGEALYLSNCAGMAQLETYVNAELLEIAPTATPADLTDLPSIVNVLTEKRLDGSIIRYKVFSPSGDKAVELTTEKLSYGYEEPGRGDILQLSDPDKIATEIYDAFWINEDTYVLVCNTTGSLKYFHTVGTAESGYGKGFTITDGRFEISK